MIKYYRVRVNPNESKIVQETLFKLGYVWSSNKDTIVKHTDKPILTIWEDKDITYGLDEWKGDITFEQFKLKHKLINKMKEFKIRVNPQQSRVVQEKCFEHGRLWQTNIAEIRFVNEPHLYSYENCITYSSDSDNNLFDKYELPELTFDEFLIEYGLPNSFAIKCIRHPLWDKYVKWWRSHFNSHCYTGQDDKYYGFKSSSRVITNAFIDARLPDNCIELTLEQWDNIVNKTNKINSMKYRLIKREYIDAVMGILYNKPSWLAIADEIIIEDPKNIQKLKDAGVLHWFEEVKDEYKVGDYITVVEGCKPYNGEVGKTYKITKVEDTHLCYDEYNSIPIISVKVRLATKDEIKAYDLLEIANKNYPIGTKYKDADNDGIAKVKGELEYDKDCDHVTDGYGGAVYSKGKWARIITNTPDISINGYMAEFFNTYVKFGCAEISKEVFIDLAMIHEYNNTNKAIESVTIGKGTFTKEQIKAIVDYYETF